MKSSDNQSMQPHKVRNIVSLFDSAISPSLWHPSHTHPPGRSQHWQLCAFPFGESHALVCQSPQERKHTFLCSEIKQDIIWDTWPFVDKEYRCLTAQTLTHNKAERGMCGGTGVGSVWAQESFQQMSWAFCTPPRGSAPALPDGLTSLSELRTSLYSPWQHVQAHKTTPSSPCVISDETNLDSTLYSIYNSSVNMHCLI